MLFEFETFLIYHIQFFQSLVLVVIFIPFSRDRQYNNILRFWRTSNVFLDERKKNTVKISTLEGRLFIWKWYASCVITTLVWRYIDRGCYVRHFNTCINGTALNQTVRTPIGFARSNLIKVGPKARRIDRRERNRRKRKEKEKGRESESLWLRANVSLKRVRCRETYRTIGFSFQRVTLPFIDPDKESLGLVCPDGLTFIGERYMEITGIEQFHRLPPPRFSSSSLACLYLFPL